MFSCVALEVSPARCLLGMGWPRDPATQNHNVLSSYFLLPFVGALDQVYPAASWRFVIDLNTYMRCFYLCSKVQYDCAQKHPLSS